MNWGGEITGRNYRRGSSGGNYRGKPPGGVHLLWWTQLTNGPSIDA